MSNVLCFKKTIDVYIINLDKRQERLNLVTKLIKRKYIQELNKYRKHENFDRNQLLLRRFLNSPQKAMFRKLSMIYHPDKKLSARYLNVN